MLTYALTSKSIIATPGRLLHLLVEMSLSLQSVQYCVFDEADRLFELGFAEQLHEILHRLPASRQTLLFSATLPGSLVGFAKAGLQSPKLIRLDVDSKISKELQMAYLSVKDGEKEAALLSLLREVIGVPLMSDEQRKAQKKKEIEIREEQDASDKARAKGKSRKRKRDEEEAPGEGGKVDPAAHQTLVFVSTKHHVEYLSSLLSCAGYSVSPIYGSMDQTARLLHLAAFRANRTSILVVTDLAARGIDIPGVENVVNYDFPNGPRAFVHRVGRTARAGRKGWAYTMVTMKELPHLLDLELFLGRPVKTCPLSAAPSSSTSPIEPEDVDYSTNLILGTVPRQLLDLDLEAHRALFTQFPHLPNLSAVSKRGQKMYEKGLQHASPASYRRSKILERAGEGLATSAGEGRGVHPVFGDFIKGFGEGKGDDEEKRANLMKFVNGFTPGETVFELGARGRASEGAKLMKERRKAMQKSHNARALAEEDEIEEEGKGLELVDEEDEGRVAGIVDEADAAEVEASPSCLSFFPAGRRLTPDVSRPSSEHQERDRSLVVLELVIKIRSFISTTNKRVLIPKEGMFFFPLFFSFFLPFSTALISKFDYQSYALTAGDSFVAQAAQAQYDVSGRGDTEGISADALLQRASTLRWDRRTKKFVKGDGLGADNKKLIKSESGQKLPASFKSGVYDDWRKKNRISVPKNGEGELKGVKIPGLAGGGAGRGGEKHYRHKAGVPKTDAERRKGRTVGKPGRLGSVGGGLKSADEVRKARVQKAKRVARSTQPGKGKKTGPGTGGGPPKKSRK